MSQREDKYWTISLICRIERNKAVIAVPSDYKLIDFDNRTEVTELWDGGVWQELDVISRKKLEVTQEQWWNIFETGGGKGAAIWGTKSTNINTTVALLHKLQFKVIF